MSLRMPGSGLRTIMWDPFWPPVCSATVSLPNFAPEIGFYSLAGCEGKEHQLIHLHDQVEKETRDAYA